MYELSKGTNFRQALWNANVLLSHSLLSRHFLIGGTVLFYSLPQIKEPQLGPQLWDIKTTTTDCCSRQSNQSVRGNGWQCNKESNLHVPQTSSTNNRKFFKQSTYLVTWCLDSHVKKKISLLEDIQRVCCCVFLSLKGSQCWQALKSSFWSLNGSRSIPKQTIHGWVPWVYPSFIYFLLITYNLMVFIRSFISIAQVIVTTWDGILHKLLLPVVFDAEELLSALSGKVHLQRKGFAACPTCKLQQSSMEIWTVTDSGIGNFSQRWF